MWTADNESEGRAGEKRRMGLTHWGECLLHFQRVENCLQRTTNLIQAGLESKNLKPSL